MENMISMIDKLNEARFEYEQNNREIMSNRDYDELYDKLADLEQLTGIIMNNSPTQNVGYEVASKLPKVKHSSKILSLGKTKSIDELKDFLNNKEAMISWKLDGLTIVATYENGRLISGITRGNGEIGEDITNNVKTFINVPLEIPFKGRLTFRGEAIITYDNFDRINSGLPDDQKYKNPRNLCSGSVRQLDSKITASRKVELIAFTLIECENKTFKSKSESLEFLNKQGFETVENKIINSPLELEQSIKFFSDNINKRKFASDGLVLTFNDIDYSKSLGIKTKTPNDSIAFKWKDEVQVTTLRDIEWNSSRTGLINPIAIFDEIELEGTTVTRASLHNISIMEDLEIGIGDEIEVFKANMIIPQVASSITKSKSFKIPNFCPVCGEPTEVKNVTNTKTLYCTNKDCLAKQLKSFTHFVGREQMNIDGLSEATLEKFINMKFIKKFSDIYELHKYSSEIRSLEGFGAKSYNNLIKSIGASKEVKIANLLYSLGIPQFGFRNAELVCKYFNNDLDKIINVDYEELLNINGIGPVMAKEFVSYFSNESNLSNFKDLIIHLNIDTSMEEVKESSITGKSFVVTGKVYQFSNRKELENKIKSLGGKILGGVNKDTDYLINNDSKSTSSKNKKAIELNISIITEDEFLELI